MVTPSNAGTVSTSTLGSVQFTPSSSFFGPYSITANVSGNCSQSLAYYGRKRYAANDNSSPVLTPNRISPTLRLCHQEVFTFYVDNFNGLGPVTSTRVPSFGGNTNWLHIPYNPNDYNNEYTWITDNPSVLVFLNQGYDIVRGKYFARFRANNPSNTIAYASVHCRVANACLDRLSNRCRVSVRNTCTGPPQVNPPVGIRNQTLSLSVNTPVGGLVRLLDSRDKELIQKPTDQQGFVNFSIEDLALEPAVYKIHFIGDDASESLIDWPYLSSSSSHLVCSPNPAVPEIDKFVNCRIVGLSDTLAPFKVNFKDPFGVLIDSFTINYPELTLDIKDKIEGTYSIEATDKNGNLWYETLQLLLDTSPILRVRSNPIDAILEGSIENPIAGGFDLDIRLSNSMGDIVYSAENQPAEGFTIQTDSFTPGVYTLIVNDGFKQYNVTVLIAR